MLGIRLFIGRVGRLYTELPVNISLQAPLTGWRGIFSLLPVRNLTRNNG